jgi:hypothetical protein
MDFVSLPSVLEFTMQEWVHCRTSWQRGSLVLKGPGWWDASSPSVRVKPPQDRWRTFRSLLDNLGAWEWQGDFGAGVMCGTPWELQLDWDGRRIHCFGNNWLANSAPEGFRHFVAGIAVLVGRPNSQLARYAQEPAINSGEGEVSDTQQSSP